MFAHTSKQESGPVKEGRVKFMQHNFFSLQPIKGAGVYLLRQITHNWNDADCVKILQAIVPVLEPGSSLLINDTIMPEHGALTRYEERNLRQVDMMMFVALGAKQRTMENFRNLLHQADPRLKVCHPTQWMLFKLTNFRLREYMLKGLWVLSRCSWEMNNGVTKKIYRSRLV